MCIDSKTVKKFIIFVIVSGYLMNMEAPCDVTSRFYYHSNIFNLFGKKIMNHETEEKKVVSSNIY